MIRSLLPLMAVVCSFAETRGRILDPARAPIANARLEAEGGLVVLTGPQGDFVLPLDSGRVRITAEGFAPKLLEKPVAGDLVLELARASETLTITEGGAYLTLATASGTKTNTPLENIPQAISVISRELMRDQMMMSLGDVVRYVPGITAHQGENNRDQVIIRGNNSSADFFVNGVRDDVQYYRDLYNLERVEALKGPNAMIFGRGGGGGVINRVTKEAGFAPLRELTLTGGQFGHRRVAGDLNQQLSGKMAVRLNALYENSGSFRDFVSLERYGFSPTATVVLGPQTKAVLAYEYFRDARTADRGVPNLLSRREQFFGNPEDSRVNARVNLGSALVEHQAGRVNLRNRTLFGAYDRGYRNYVPGAVNAQDQVSLSAYANATGRLNVFNQTDVTLAAATGRVRHTLLAGAEVGRQATENFRTTGYFNSTATSVLAPFADAVLRTPITFRQSGTDADNHVVTQIAAAYAQDQIEVTRKLQVVAGVRVDRFDLDYRNRRNGDRLERLDPLVSPRFGVVYKPVANVSLYANQSVSYLPSAGDQFASLTNITQQVKPEKFTNRELGVKWTVRDSLSLTAALYRLDRTNTRSVDPNDPTRIVQTGSQRSNGLELGVAGNVMKRWQIAGGYAWQDAYVSSATAAARAGARVAQVPRHGFSLWNNWQVTRRLGAGLGVLNRTDSWAAIDNTVRLPGYMRADAAVFYSLTEKIRLQGNVENVFDRRYFLNADSNTNISPGSPRAMRLGLIARF